MLPQVAQTLPEDVQMTPLFDQSLFVRAAIEGVSRRINGGVPNSRHDSPFPGQLAQHLIIAISIPLSILTSIILLSAIGETFNINDAWRPGARGWCACNETDAESRLGCRKSNSDLVRAAICRWPVLCFHRSLILHRLQAHQPRAPGRQAS